MSTERWGGDWPEMLNTLVLVERDGKTQLENTVLYPSKETCDAALRTGMRDAVAKSFDRLAAYLKTMAMGRESHNSVMTDV